MRRIVELVFTARSISKTKMDSYVIYRNHELDCTLLFSLLFKKKTSHISLLVLVRWNRLVRGQTDS